MFRIDRAQPVVKGLIFLGLLPSLVLSSCRAAPLAPHRAPTIPAVAIAATPTAALPTPTELTSAEVSASATPATSLIAIGSLATLVASTPTASGDLVPTVSPTLAAPTATAIPRSAASAIATARPAASPTAASVQTAGPARAVPAVALQPYRSAQGDYVIAVPAGWSLNAVAGTGAITITPRGQSNPAIYIIPAIRVSDVRYQTILNQCSGQFSQNPLGAPDTITGCIEPAVRSQLADSSHPWSPRAAFPVIFGIAASGGVTFGSPDLSAVSSTELRYAVQGTKNGQAFAEWGYLGMGYLPNPLLGSGSGQPGVTSLAFLSGCQAPVSQVESFRTVCESVLRSFSPSQQWANALAQQVMRGYVQEYQTLLQIGESVVEGFGVRSAMISQFGASMQQMQDQTFQNIQAANLRTGRNWIAAFGNNVYVQDQTTGKSYVAPAGYGAYCLNAAGNQILVGGSDLVPGKFVGNAGNPCATLLRPEVN